MPKSKKTTICVRGMHCPSCDILVASKFNEVENIKSVKPDHVNQKVEIEYEGELDHNKLNGKIAAYGYEIVDKKELQESQEPLSRRIIESLVLGMIVLTVYLIAGELNLLPASMMTTLNLGSAFLVGVIASLSTCMATTGALYLATIGKLHDKTSTLKEKMIPAISFNLGRILAYTLLGAVNGLVGQFLIQEAQMGTVLNVIIGIFMVFIGLDMLRILPLDRIIPGKGYKKFFLGVEKRLMKHPRRTSFLLGVLTYWLPCGFTQSVQLYALSIADPLQSALIMLFFALGTTPVLLMMGFVSSIMKTSYYHWFMKTVAVLVILIGLSYLLNFLNLYNLNPFQNVFSSSGKSVQAQQEGSEQIIRMTVTYKGYTPNTFTVQKGRPVKWIIDGKEVFGCQGYLMAPKIDVETILKQGENVITFVPQETGVIGFSCSMGMYNGTINVIEG